ncbi:autotransporter outer membrane beta-barrel domain-containing protein [Pantoea agglomerans]|uniref:autotransporter outer membrane beta-barrel domain-containing protein n=1 Tax=Enterobacter agglomerans TaxID=549 RepID=UPI0013CBFC4A|nr:autotransporter outer membrane beta-barrel domain-containing protein [Pantoea agglomerans]NEG81057.1 autotransporter outer membrane beta-barrel domain-containing protein [Pantoea agglomerans]
MNKVFKVIWNAQMNAFVVVSELAKGHCRISRSLSNSNSFKRAKTFTLSAIVLAFYTTCTSEVIAADIQVHDFTPQDPFEVVISGSSRLIGSFAGITKGASGSEWMTLEQARSQGLITDDSAQWVDKDIFRIGSQTKSINYKDPVTGSTVTMKVFDNSDMQTEAAKDFKVVVSTPVGKDGQYVDRNFYQVGAGDSLDVDVGQKTGNWVGAAENQFNVILKSSVYNKNQSSAFHVTDGGSINYQAKTVVQLGNNDNNIKDASNALAWMTAADFVGSFESVIGEQNITNVEEFKAYNDALIKALQDGTIQLTEEQYAAELNKARDATVHGIFADTDAIAPDDAVRAFVNRDAVSYIHGEGSNSNVTIDNDANIQLVGSDATVVNLENGATLTNNGTLGTAGNTYRGAYVIAARNTSFVENNGVIDAGTNPEMAAFFQSGATGVAAGIHTAILANGQSVVNNNTTGVINVAARENYYGNTGVLMSGSATLNNDGAINIAASNEASSILGDGANIGVVTQQNTTFNNRGTLYIGRLAQRAPTDTTSDIAIKQQSIGVQLYGNGIYNGSDASQIVIGSKVQNATAIDVSGAAMLNQQGSIDINGAVTGESVSSNIGILAREGTQAAKVVNAGVINLNGMNSIGVQAQANAQVTSSGTINVNGELDPITHYANYGIYAQGEKALAILSGTVNLSGDGAIGVHARDKGEIDVTENGTVNFTNGINQTGYYIFGAGSTIKNAASSVQDASTEGSTLYRVDGGASFAGSADRTSELDASGEEATIIRTTGAGSHFDSGKLALSVTGTGATGIRIEGGATGEITPYAVIVKVAGKDTTAGIVDGNYYNLDGAVDATKKGDSVLTSHAMLETANTADGAFGYIARNGGRLIHEGSIDFTTDNSTGVLVDGGILENRSGITVNGVAVNIQGENSVVTNSGIVTATNGTAAYLVGNNATLALNGNGETRAAGTANGILLDTGAKGLIVNGATINMDSAGSGNAIENKAAISGIQLKDTTINVGNGVGVHTGASMAQTNTGTINVNGSGTGILFENVADSSETDQMLDMSDSRDLTINVNAAEGNGIITRASSNLKTGASVNVLNSVGNSALVVEGTTKNVEQSGKLTSVADDAAVVDLNNGVLETFTNEGDILAADADHKALEMTGGKGIVLTNASGANIRGQVNLLSGDNTVILESGSTATDVTGGAGKDRFILQNIRPEDNDTLFTSLNGGSGEDTLRLENSTYTLKRADAITGMEHIDLASGSWFTLNKVALGLGDDGQDGDGTGYSIDGTSLLNLLSNTDVAFKSHLDGTGTMVVDTAGNHFSFTANNADDGFAGTMALINSQFELGGLNTRALNAATLRVGEGSITHVAFGEQHIGGLAFDGGTVKFEGVTPGNPAAQGTIHSGTMDLTGRGTVQVDSGSVSNDRPQIDTHLSLLEQDDARALIKLATSDAAVVGGAGNLVLVDKDGNAISDAITADINQQGTVVAEGTYDYRLTGGDGDDGLYVSYGLTQVDLLGKGADALILDANGKNGNAADMSAKVTGSGDLAFDSQKVQIVTLSNMDNDYSGITDVRSGNLAMLNDNVLGKTSEVKLADATGFDMRGHAQTVGKLTAEKGSLTNLNGGHLTLTNGGESAGVLAGAGQLKVAGGTLNVSGANAALKATTTIARGATASLNNALGLGSGNIVAAGLLNLNNAAGVLYNSLSDAGKIALNSSDVVLTGDNSGFSGTFAIDRASTLSISSARQLGTAAVTDNGKLVLNAEDSWALTNSVTGSGSVVKNGSGSVMLDEAAQWTGDTDINAGGVILGSADKSMMLASQQVNVQKDGHLSGFGGVAGNIDNKGTLLVGDSNRPAVSPVTFTTGGNLINSGNVWTGSSSVAGNQLVVNGNYQGNGGHLHLNTALNDDNSVTDKLIVNGNTSGTTGVSVTNAGGTGAQTLNGIEVIHVDGQSDGNFTQDGRIVAGAYDYSLVRGQGNKDSNWYLTSHKGNPDPDQKPDPKPAPDIRPEPGSYTANLAAANTLFVTRLHDRLGETQYTDALLGEQKVTSLWMRQVGGHNAWRDGSGQLKTQSNRYVIQMGGDIARWSGDGLDRWHLGVMAGYGHNSSNTRSSSTGYSSDGSVNGYSAGLYATWYANDETHQGAYLDSWAQYNWFNNSVKGQNIQNESYKSKGVTGSLELGYTHKLGEFTGSKGSLNEWYIQPQAQAVWMGVKADGHREANGTLISGEGDGNVQTRLGVRTFLKSHSAIDDGKDREFEPFVEVNWLHNTRDFGTRMDGVSIRQAGASNLGEIKTGVEGQLNSKLNIWGNVGVQMGDKGYSDAAAMVGVKYSFK